jgi:hypothetical protein
MIASCIMALAISTAVTTLQYGYRQIDTARNTTLAGQILQSLIEDVRMRPWATGSGTTGVIDLTNVTDQPLSVLDTTGSFNFNSTATTILTRFTFSRSISDVTGMVDIKKIVLTAKWKGVNGQSHTVTYTTYYAKNGLWDYYNN